MKSGRKVGDFSFRWPDSKTLTNVGFFGDQLCPRKNVVELASIVLLVRHLLVVFAELGKLQSILTLLHLPFVIIGLEGRLRFQDLMSNQKMFAWIDNLSLSVLLHVLIVREILE